MCGAPAMARDNTGIYYCQRDLDFAFKNLDHAYADRGDDWRTAISVPDDFGLEVRDGVNA